MGPYDGGDYAQSHPLPRARRSRGPALRGRRSRQARGRRGAVRHTAIGVNYIDVYDRTGLYPGELPSGLGREAAGVITAVGRKVRGFRVGDRVAYVHPKPGAYSELRNVPRRAAGEGAEGRLRRAGGRPDAEGPDRAVPAAPHLPRRARARPFSCTPPPAASDSSCASGRRRSARRSSAWWGARPRRSSPASTAASTC